MVTLEQSFLDLPADIRQEALDFIQFLVQKRGLKKGNKLSLDWAGGLREYRDQFTSVELQKKASEWWGT